MSGGGGRKYTEVSPTWSGASKDSAPSMMQTGGGFWGSEAMELSEAYLGDGVYAVFDGYCIWLDCRAQNCFSLNPSNIPAIALEPSVLQSLIEFAKQCSEK